VARLGDRGTLHAIEDADHSFHVRKSSGSDDATVRHAMADVIAEWMSAVLSRRA
jgi:hypothetical protein